MSRISAVADIFDALSCPRDYKAAKPLEVVKNILADMSGSHIDPAVHKALLDLLDEGKRTDSGGFDRIDTGP